MHVVTLLSNPEAPSLKRDVVDSLCNAWGGSDPLWLAPEEAAEFQIAEIPTKRWATWRDLQKYHIDLVVQKAEGRKKKLLLADMDSTMIGQECIDELATEAGIGDYVAMITARAMNGELKFEDALRERVALLKGLETSVIETVLRNRITLAPGSRSLVATMKANGAYTALVSGGFTDFTSRIAVELGFDEDRANVLLAESGKLTGKVAHPILGEQAKVSALSDISAKLGFKADGVIAVGDGANDLGMLNLAGTGVALHAKPSVAAQCDVRINHGDLTALLFLQGYAKQEFVN